MKDLEHCSEMNVTFTEESSSFHIQTTINDSLDISNKGNEIQFQIRFVGLSFKEFALRTFARKFSSR